eukprot:9488746-Pyramimonas_sp.AAC.1
MAVEAGSERQVGKSIDNRKRAGAPADRPGPAVGHRRSRTRRARRSIEWRTEKGNYGQVLSGAEGGCVVRAPQWTLHHMPYTSHESRVLTQISNAEANPAAATGPPPTSRPKTTEAQRRRARAKGETMSVTGHRLKDSRTQRILSSRGGAPGPGRGLPRPLWEPFGPSWMPYDAFSGDLEAPTRPPA